MKGDNGGRRGKGLEHASSSDPGKFVPSGLNLKFWVCFFSQREKQTFHGSLEGSVSLT